MQAINVVLKGKMSSTYLCLFILCRIPSTMLLQIVSSKDLRVPVKVLYLHLFKIDTYEYQWDVDLWVPRVLLYLKDFWQMVHS